MNIGYFISLLLLLGSSTPLPSQLMNHFYEILAMQIEII